MSIWLLKGFDDVLSGSYVRLRTDWV